MAPAAVGLGKDREKRLAADYRDTNLGLVGARSFGVYPKKIPRLRFGLRLVTVFEIGSDPPHGMGDMKPQLNCGTLQNVQKQQKTTPF